MLNNQQALELLLNSFAYFNNDRLMAIIDRDMNILASTKAALEASNLSPTKNKINIADLPRSNELIFKKAQITYNKSWKKKLDIQFISINFMRKPGFQILRCNLTPMINKDTGDIVAILSTAQPLEYATAWHKIEKFIAQNQSNQRIAAAAKQTQLLTPKEQEIIFLLFCCDSYEEIANIINLSHRSSLSGASIGQTLRRSTFNKFKVSNLADLKRKALALNYHKKVPLTLLHEMLIEVNEL